MSVLTQLQDALPELSKNERKVAEYFLKFPYDAKRFSCEAIASTCSTSRSAVIRLCQKLGYHGYAEFKYALSSQIADFRDNPSDPAPDPCVLDFYSACISQLKTEIPSDRLSAIADVILHANRVVTLGFEHSHYAASQMSFRLNRLYIDSHSISDLSLAENYERILKQGDVAIIFSISAREMYRDIAKVYRQNRVTVILVTMMSHPSLAKSVDYVLELPFVSHAASKYLLDDAITFFLTIEMMIEAINKKIQLNEEEQHV